MIAVFKLPDGALLNPIDMSDVRLTYYEVEGVKHAGIRGGWCREIFSRSLASHCHHLIKKGIEPLVDIHGIIIDMKGPPEDYRECPMVDPDPKLDAPYSWAMNAMLTTVGILTNPELDVTTGSDLLRNCLECTSYPKPVFPAIGITPGIDLVKDVVPLNETGLWNRHDAAIRPIGSLTNVPAHWLLSRPIASFITYMVRMWSYLRTLEYIPCITLNTKESLRFQARFLEQFPAGTPYYSGAYYLWGHVARHIILPSFMTRWGRASFWTFYYLLVNAATHGTDERKAIAVAELNGSNDSCNGYVSYLNRCILGSEYYRQEQCVYKTLVKEGPTGLFKVRVQR